MSTHTKTVALADALRDYMNMFPAFRNRPEGAPNSTARKQQEAHIAIEDKARQALAQVAP